MMRITNDDDRCFAPPIVGMPRISLTSARLHFRDGSANLLGLDLSGAPSWSLKFLKPLEPTVTQPASASAQMRARRACCGSSA